MSGNPLSLLAVSSFVPQRLPLGALQAELGLTDSEIARYLRYYGLSRVARDPSMTEADLLRAAVAKLDHLRGQEDRVRYVLRARTALVSAPYPANAVAEVCQDLGLDRAVAFTVTHQLCASGLLAVDLCGRLLAHDGDTGAMALILLGEKVFTPIGGVIPETTVTAEGTAAVLIGLGGSRDRLLSYATRTYGNFYADLVLTPQAAADFRKIYPAALADVISAAMSSARVGHVDLVLPHNVNRISWAQVAKRLGFSLDQIFLDNVAEIGHCFCADPFINLQTAAELGRLNPGDVYVMTSVGLGATFAAMVFRH